jgi:hypothetical protein
MTFRYMSAWLFWPLSCFGGLAVLAVLLTPTVLLKPVLSSYEPDVVVPLVVAISLAVGTLVLMVVTPLLSRLKLYCPGRPIILTKQGLDIDLEIGFKGHIPWAGVKHVKLINSPKSPNRVTIEFRRKITLDFNGANFEFARIILTHSRIIPSGDLFLSTAERYLAEQA